jgi:exonuclease VII small subunit
MAGTTKLTRHATLEDITRRCNVAVSTRSSLVEEAMTLIKQSVGYVNEAEQQINSALGVVMGAKPMFLGSSEYMVSSSRLLDDVTAELENDLQEVRSVQVCVQAYDAPTNEILDLMVASSVETIQARIRARMHKLGGEFSIPAPPRPSNTQGSLSVPPRRRSELPAPTELLMDDMQEQAPIESLLESGLGNFERCSEALESCFYTLSGAQALIGNAIKTLAALADKYRALDGLENSSSSQRVREALENLRLVIQDISKQTDRLNAVAGAAERVRPPLLAVMDNMGKLLLTVLRGEQGGSASEPRDAASARDVLQQVLRGDLNELSDFNAVATLAERESLTEALFHATRTRELEEASHAVEALKQIALMGAGQRTDAGDRLLSLSNSLSVSEAVRAAATAALIDLTGDQGDSE